NKQCVYDDVYTHNLIAKSGIFMNERTLALTGRQKLPALGQETWYMGDNKRNVHIHHKAQKKDRTAVFFENAQS
ncbi:MAG: hypothetical protein RR449_06850, partial [Christensenella sp.]